MTDQAASTTVTLEKPSQDNSSPPRSAGHTTKTTNAHQSTLMASVTSLSEEDLRLVRIAIGVPGRNPDDNQPKLSSIWPPRTLSRGLYNDVVTSRTKAQYSYYFSATLYNTCLVLQLLLGASLTALGSSSSKNYLAITILAAANTVNAGLVALLHNSGLPTRFRNDWIEYDKVEMFLDELMDTGIVEDGMTRDDVVVLCWKKYMSAKATVDSNKPTIYTNGLAVGSGVPTSVSTGATTTLEKTAMHETSAKST